MGTISFMYGLWTHKSIFSELINNCSKTLLKINKNFFFASYFFCVGKKTCTQTWKVTSESFDRKA